MVDKERLDNAIDLLNAALGELTPYRIVALPPGDIVLLKEEENARYMTKKVYERLVENIRRDRNLSSLPFLWRETDGVYICLSGNHRVMAARDAGVMFILALYTDAAMSREERVAVQLSHNSLVGLDDPARLKSLWNEIESLNWKVYTGLDDGLLATYNPIEIQRVAENGLRFEELRLLFVEPEIEHVKEAIKRIGSSRYAMLLGDMSVFDRFFDVLIRFKEKEEILNTATAFLAMTDMVEKWLGDIEHNEVENEPQN